MSLFFNTPQLNVIEPRTYLIRRVDYHRAREGASSEARVTRHSWDTAGRHVADQDPRLWSTGTLLNTATVRSLSNALLLQENVDAGWRVILPGADGQSLENWDGRGGFSRLICDECSRPQALYEKQEDCPQPSTVERFTYGDNSAESARHNQCGRLTRHDDTAGTRRIYEYALNGGALAENRRFLASVLPPDWPQDADQRDALLESVDGFTSSACVDALGAPVEQTDPAGNRSTSTYGVSGRLEQTGVWLTGASSHRSLVSKIAYNANGQVEMECLGNGVISKLSYDASSGRSTRILSAKADGTLLQDLNYEYDPVGNIVSITDATQPTRFAGNQKVEPISRYRYDSLYQLIEASGREVSSGPSHGPAISDLQTPMLDPNKLSNYTQTYTYDAGNNLLEMHHQGEQPFSRKMIVSPVSNRSMPELEIEADFSSAFDANGNLQNLTRGQSMHWNLRNHLRLVKAVQRENGVDDDEIYIYDGDGQRCRKINTAQANTRTVVSEVRYLPGLEIRNLANGEVLEVATFHAERSSIRILHWAEKKPDGIDNDQVRYSIGDHLGSCTLELDGQGAVISQEGYYPFGGTAWWTARSAVEAGYKTVRYSGKERDATGLYYYGSRYYAPWVQRWINPDPLGSVDGLNLYCFVGNTPINKFDVNGLAGVDLEQLDLEQLVKAQSAARRYVNPIKVRRITQGVTSVSIKGDRSVFARVGIYLDRDTEAPRDFHYLALDNSLRGKVSGGDATIKLGSAKGADIEAASGSMPAAYINGGYFNMGQKKPNERSAEHASVGENFIDGRPKQFVEPPADYASKYSKLTLNDGSYIHVAPKLSTRGVPQFSRRDSLLPQNTYGETTNHVGALGHAGDPNARSGISLAQNGTAKTRIAITLNQGRGTFQHNTNEPGATMLEWTAFMSRLDNLNPKNEEGFPAASSWNLDGGDSSALGVLDDAGEHLLRVNTLKVGRGLKPARPIGNFLSWHR